MYGPVQSFPVVGRRRVPRFSLRRKFFIPSKMYVTKHLRQSITKKIMKKNRFPKLNHYVALGLMLCSGVYAQAQTSYSELSKKLASDRLGGDRFGYSVAVDGNYAVVGAPYHAHGFTATGSAYIFERDASGNWNQIQEIVAGDRKADDHFGWSVSINGDDIVVGAPDQDYDAFGLNGMTNSGAVYVYKKSGATWGQVNKFVASDRETGDQFGWSVDVYLNNIVAGAPYQEDPGGTDEGAIYVMTRTTSSAAWSFLGKTKATDKRNDDHFGYSVSIFNFDIAVGAPDQDYDATGSGGLLADAGAVYSITRSSGTWVQSQKMVSSDRRAGDKFGFSVSRINVALVVGAPYQDYPVNSTLSYYSGAGAAYVFDKNGTWIETQKLVASDRQTGDNFGWSVARTSMDIVVGSPSDDQLSPTMQLNAGSIYVYSVTATASWTQTQKLVASDIAANDAYGSAVGISDTKIIVGAPYDDHTTPFTQTDAGSAYVLEGCPYPATLTTNETVVTACIGQDLELSSFLGFGIAASYQWQVHNGTSYVNVTDGALYAGSTTVFLTINNIPHCMDGTKYRCKLTATCGAVVYYYYLVNVDAASFNQKTEVAPGVAASNDRFGDDVAISGNYAIVGAPFEDEDASDTPGSAITDAGSAYIYERNGSGSWVLVKKIVANTRGTGANFGAAVAMYGDYAVVGAPNEDIGAAGQAGAVYIYQRISGVWTYIDRIIAPFQATDDFYGSSVAIDSDLQIIVGARNEDQNSSGTSGTLTNAGAAYVYVYDVANSKWSTLAPFTIVPSDRAAGDNFGWAVDIDGSFAVISAVNDDDNFSSPAIVDVGSVYIFQRTPGNIWTLAKKFTEDIQPLQQYGGSVSIYGGEVAVGSKSTDVNNVDEDEGKVYMYKSNPTWQRYQIITAPLPLEGGNFGQDVSLSGNYLAVGANRADLFGSGGGVYMFERCNTVAPWNFLETIIGTSGIAYGKSVDLAGAYFITGAPMKNTNAGTAYVFESCGESALKSAGTDAPATASEPVGISAQSVQPSMNCFPIPATNEINLVVNNMPDGSMTATVVDLNGRAVVSMNITADNTRIALDQIAPGVYFVKLNYNGGSMIQKIVKQ